MSSSDAVDVGNEGKVLVIATDDDFWSLYTMHRVACHSRTTLAGAKYIAFYRIHPVSAVTHYAPVLVEERESDARQTFAQMPQLIRRAEREGWLARPHTRYRLGKPVELRQPVVKAATERPIRSKKWTTLGRLLCARTLRDL